MRVPKAAIVQGRIIPTEIVDEVATHTHDLDEDLQGACTYPPRSCILIDRDYDPDDRARNWFHEVIHARWPAWPESLVEQVEELYPILRDSGVWRRR